MNLSDTFVREIDYETCGKSLKIHQLEVGDVGCVVWDAAIVLSKYLSLLGSAEESIKTKDLDLVQKTPLPIRARKVVEIGSGTGVVGLLAAALGADVAVTDLPEFVPLMEKNIATNSDVIEGKCIAQALVWGKTETQDLLPVDIVLVADCLYYDESISPLVSTIEALSSPDTTVLCCHEDRSDRGKEDTQKQFFKLMDVNFSCEEVPQEEQDLEYHSPDIHIHRFRRRTAK